jgi:translation initiation factor 1A
VRGENEKGVIPVVNPVLKQSLQGINITGASSPRFVKSISSCFSILWQVRSPGIHTFIVSHTIHYSNGVAGIRNNSNNDDFDPNAVNEDGSPVVRVRLPKKWANEQFAFADLMMGANHIRVRCYDGVTRMGRIKGKIKKRVWIREGDILIVTPWSFQDEKCDIVYRYLPPQADWLRKNRYL